MEHINRFERFAEDFEAAVADDDWTRLEKHLAEDVTYLNVGGPDPISQGRDTVITYLKTDVEQNDRRFDTRTVIALTPPSVEANRLSRQWRCTYTLAGAPNLVIEGEARYLFEGDLIKQIEEEVTVDSLQKLEAWMRDYGELLQT